MTTLLCDAFVSGKLKPSWDRQEKGSIVRTLSGICHSSEFLQNVPRGDHAVLFTTVACRIAIRFRSNRNRMLLGNLNPVFYPLRYLQEVIPILNGNFESKNGPVSYLSS